MQATANKTAGRPAHGKPRSAKVNTLYGSLPIVAAALGDKYGVKVVVGGSEFVTDGSTICVPAIDPEEEGLKSIVYGGIAHESGHIRFTDWNVFETCGNPLRHQLLNVIEDVRIELALAQQYPGTRNTIAKLFEHYRQRGFIKAVKEDDHPAEILGNYALHRLRSSLLKQQCFADLAELDEAVVQKVFPAGAVVRLHALFSEVPNLESTADARDLVDLVLSMLKQEEDKARQQPQEGRQRAEQDQEAPSQQNGEAHQQPGPGDGQDSDQPDDAGDPDADSSVQGGGQGKSGDQADGAQGKDDATPDPGDDAGGQQADGNDPPQSDPTGQVSPADDGDGGGNAADNDDAGGDDGGKAQDGAGGATPGPDGDDGADQHSPGGGSDGNDGADQTHQGLSGPEQPGGDDADAGGGQGHAQNGAADAPASASDGGDTQKGSDAGMRASDNGGSDSSGGDGSGSTDPSAGQEAAANYDPDGADAIAAALNATADDVGSEDIFRRAAADLAASAKEVPIMGRLPDMAEPEPGPEDSKRGQEIISRVRVTSGRVRTQLLGLVQASQHDEVVTRRHGRSLDSRRLSRLAVGDSRVFTRCTEHRAPNTAVHLLLDRSGSMSTAVGGGHGDRWGVALNSGVSLAMALETISGVNPAVTAFPAAGHGGVIPILEHGQRVKQVIGKLALSVAGSTPMAEAMWYAAAKLINHTKEERKILMVVTDGQPNNAPQVLDMVRRCEASGIELIGIGIQLPSVKDLFPTAVVIDDVTDLRRVLFEAARRALTGR